MRLLYDKRVLKLKNIFDVQTDAKKKINEAQTAHKKYLDAAHEPPLYRIGDLVLVNNSRRNSRKRDKLVPRWSSTTFAISEVRPKGLYIAQTGRAQTTFQCYED